MKKYIFIALLLSLSILSACSSCPENDGRTYYDRLDLDTPENAVKTFTEAFAKDDYPTVHLIFSKETQFRWRKVQQATFTYDHLLNPDYSDKVTEIIQESYDNFEHNYPAWELFDNIMMAGDEYDAFLIDLNGEVTIIDTKPSQSELVEEDTTDVIAEVEGIEGEVIFRMVETPSGKWRVVQVLVPGGDEGMFPWAVPSIEE